MTRLKALYSHGSVDKSRHGDEDPSLLNSLLDIYDAEGVEGLYRGVTPQLLKVSNVLSFSLVYCLIFVAAFSVIVCRQPSG
jgi:hypothetical protein